VTWSGPRLKALRVAAGLSQQALARRLAVTLRTVRNWERGTSPPRFETGLRLARALGCTPNALAGWPEPGAPAPPSP